MRKLMVYGAISCALVITSLPESAKAEQLLTDQPLYASPNSDAAVNGHGKKGTVAVLGRKGFWLQIKADNVTGWTKLTNVRVEKSAGGLEKINTGRGAN